MPGTTRIFVNGEPVSDTNRLPVDADIVLGDTTINTEGLATEATLADVETAVGAGNTLQTAANTLLTNANTALDGVNSELDAQTTLITAANVLLTAIRDALQVIDNAVAGSEYQVDVVTAPDSRESWRVSAQDNTTTNSSAKTFTVPANTEWQVISVRVDYTTNATVGDRRVAVRHLDASNNILNEVRVPQVQVASATRNYQLSQGIAQESDFVSGSSFLPVSLPSMVAGPGEKIQILDANAVAAAGTGENLLVRMRVVARSIS